MSWEDFVKKINPIKPQLQSIIVLSITATTGYKLYKIANTIYSPAGIAGSIFLALGILYSFVSFFTINLREHYEDIISGYKTMNKETRASYKAMHKEYKDSVTEAHNIFSGEYKSQVENRTSDE